MCRKGTDRSEFHPVDFYLDQIRYYFFVSHSHLLLISEAEIDGYVAA